MKRIIIVQAMSPFMEGESYQPEAQLTAKMQNFVSWYRYLSGKQDKVHEIGDGLKYMVDNFNHFKLVKTVEPHHVLNVSFSQNGNGHHPYQYRFHEMADGNRALITLYTLIHYARFSDYTLCIDEPENFLALWEIQPWLRRLYDFCDDQVQTLLISHHPEIVGYFASFAGYWFERQSNTPARVKRVTEEDEGGIPILDLVARGWFRD
jgi:predicted ATPase